MPIPVYGLLFDMDGVLADTESLIADATIDMFRQLYSTELKREDFRPFIGTGAVRYIEGPAEQFGIAIDTERALEQRQANYKARLKTLSDIACPGALALIEHVAAQPDWKLAIATGSPAQKASFTIQAAHIPIERFSAYVNGDQVAHPKPHPEIYLRAAENLETPPMQCVVVEDAVAGVQAAKAAGMKCIAVTGSFHRADLVDADRIVDSLEEIDLMLLRKLVA
jgi:beta-phosphoglucomutase